jgi:uncharacterized protein
MAVFLVIQAPPTLHAAEPSFPCSKAKTPVEKAICDSEVLSKLDRDLANTYDQLKQAFVTFGQGDRKDQSSNASIITEQQRDWIRFRGRSCNASEDIAKCIQAITEERIGVLGGGAKPMLLAGWFESADKTSKLVIFPTKNGYIARIQSVGCDIKAKINIDSDGSFRFIADSGNAVFLLVNGRSRGAEPNLEVRSVGFPRSGVDAISQDMCRAGDVLRNRYLRYTPRGS